MNELSDMLVPLETLPGWPTVTDPTPLQSLGLLIGLPALVFVLIFAIAKIGNMAKASRGSDATATDPVWVGGPSRPDIEGPRHDQVEIEAADIADKPGTDVGGAGARW